MRSIVTDFVLIVFGTSATLTILAKSTIMLVVALAIAAAATHIRASWRHLIFATTFGLLLALPLVVTTGPALAVEVPVTAQQVQVQGDAAATNAAATASAAAPSAITTSGASASTSWTMPPLSVVLSAIWAIGAILLMGSLLLDLWRVRSLRRHGLPSGRIGEMTRDLVWEAGLRRQVDVLLHEGIPAPFTCGWLRPAIILPAVAADWNEMELKRAIVHELEHVRRGDWASQVAARVACAFYWFHPLVWMVWRKLCLEAERACDDAVVETAETTLYAEQLVELSQQMSAMKAQPVLGMAKRSDLARRVAALLDATQQRGRAGLVAAVCSVVVGGFVLFSIGPLKAVAQLSKPQAATPANSSMDKQHTTDSPLDRALYEAAESGNNIDVTRLLNAGANVNAVINGDGSPLIAAARSGHVDTVRVLLDRGADVDLAVPGDGNPLIMASRDGHLAVVLLLLDRGADVNLVVPTDENALIQAAGSGHLDVVKLLVERGADVNASVTVDRGNGTGVVKEVRTPLSMARKARHASVEQYLLSKGARPE